MQNEKLKSLLAERYLTVPAKTLSRCPAALDANAVATSSVPVRPCYIWATDKSTLFSVSTASCLQVCWGVSAPDSPPIHPQPYSTRLSTTFKQVGLRQHIMANSGGGSYNYVQTPPLFQGQRRWPWMIANPDFKVTPLLPMWLSEIFNNTRTSWASCHVSQLHTRKLRRKMILYGKNIMFKANLSNVSSSQSKDVGLNA